MRYTFVIINNGAENEYESNSRNSIKHLRDHGGNCCIVYNKSGKIVSAAEYSDEFGYYHIYL